MRTKIESNKRVNITRGICKIELNAEGEKPYLSVYESCENWCTEPTTIHFEDIDDMKQFLSHLHELSTKINADKI